MKNFNLFSLLLVSVLAFSSCSKAPKIQDGTLITLHYTGTLKDGEVFDSTQGKQPFKFLVGSGTVLPAFEKVVVTLDKGAKKKFMIKAKDAYEHDPKLVGEVPRDNRFEGIELVEGAVISASRQLPNGEMQKFPVTVIEVKEDTVKLDYNPPIVGKDLYFDVEILDLELPEETAQASEEETTPVESLDEAESQEAELETEKI